MDIRTGADRLMRETGLLALLQRHGTPLITGSYSMDLMAWNDLDLYLLPSAEFDFYAMAADLNAALRPARFEGSVNEKGVFYGCETFLTGEGWNVDLWIRTEEQIRESRAGCDLLVQKIKAVPGAKEAIVGIKTDLISGGMYGLGKHPTRHYHSRDIYDAVLNEGIFTAEELLRAHPL